MTSFLGASVDRALPDALLGRLRLPLIVSPMFLVSGPELVTAAARAGVLGAFPSLNARSTDEYAAWLAQIDGAQRTDAAPFAVNLIVHRSNARLEADVAVTVAHQVPVVITSLGADSRVVDAVHGYGGLVLHDVVSAKHARKAAEAGVDGLIAVCAGAGGHTGSLSPFALVAEIREFFGGLLILAGGMSRGEHIAAARIMGADLAAMGTRFIATRESRAAPAYKRMLVDSTADDVLATAALTGVTANFLKPSIATAGLELPTLRDATGKVDLPADRTPWRDIWSAGHGVSQIGDVPAAADLIDLLREEYRRALAGQARSLAAT